MTVLRRRLAASFIPMFLPADARGARCLARGMTLLGVDSRRGGAGRDETDAPLCVI